MTNLWDKHSAEMDEKDCEDAGIVTSGSGEGSEVVSVEDLLNIGSGNGRHAGYKTWSTASYSN